MPMSVEAPATAAWGICTKINSALWLALSRCLWLPDHRGFDTHKRQVLFAVRLRSSGLVSCEVPNGRKLTLMRGCRLFQHFE